MFELKLGRVNNLSGNIRCSIRALLKSDKAGQGAALINSELDYLNRTIDLPISLELYQKLQSVTKHIGVTKNFKEVIDYFQIPEGETPAGFRIEYVFEEQGVLRIDLVRDISYGKNGQKRPTKVLFSADSANPYEIEPVKGIIANLTCNPGIVYDLFINNPKANIGNKFKTRDEVMQEIGRILGPGADISVELNNPFEESEQKILEEAQRFREMLSPYRVVIKVPHTGPVNAENVSELLNGDQKFQRRYDQGSTSDLLRGHNLALMLRENGYRINFTLMFEPYQTAMALQAKPYFINSFIRHRFSMSQSMKSHLDLYNASKETRHLEDLKDFFISKDLISPVNSQLDLFEIKRRAEQMLTYRNFDNSEGYDGLDAVRHNLRLLRQCNLPDTRLIICSMEGERNFAEIDKLLAGDEFEDMTHRVIVTTEPAYLAAQTTSAQVISYQRRFMNAAKGQK